MDKITDLQSFALFFNNELEKKLDDKLKKLDILDVVLEKFDEVKKKQDVLEQKCINLEASTSALREEVNNLNATVNELKQSQCSDKVIVRGIPEVESTDLELVSLVESIFNALNIDDNNLNTKTVHRIGKLSSDKKVVPKRPIEVQLSSPEQVQLIVKAKKSELSCKNIVFRNKAVGKESDKVYIEQKLTPYNSYLFYVARSLKKQGVVKYSWTDNGRVLIRVSENAKIQRIEHEGHLVDLVKDKPNQSMDVDGSRIEKSYKESLDKFFRDLRKKNVTVRPRGDSQKRGASPNEVETPNKRLAGSTNSD